MNYQIHFTIISIFIYVSIRSSSLIMEKSILVFYFFKIFCSFFKSSGFTRYSVTPACFAFATSSANALADMAMIGIVVASGLLRRRISFPDSYHCLRLSELSFFSLNDCPFLFPARTLFPQNPYQLQMSASI